MGRRVKVILPIVLLGIVALSAVLAFFTFRSSARNVDRTVNTMADKLLDAGPPAPAPSQTDAASGSLPPEGRLVTIKQNDKTWLPGGQYQLHLDDITGRQVVVSATDAQGQVVFGPKSVKKDEAFLLPDDRRAVVQVEVKRLKNMLAGGDFGEFLVTAPAGPMPDPPRQPSP